MESLRALTSIGCQQFLERGCTAARAGFLGLPRRAGGMKARDGTTRRCKWADGSLEGNVKGIHADWGDSSSCDRQSGGMGRHDATHSVAEHGGKSRGGYGWEGCFVVVGSL